MGDDSKPTAVERKGSDPPGQSSRPTGPVGGPRYANGAEIARGGMGRVVEATDTLLDRVVAVKEALTSDPDTLRRFARETRITARLEHPSIVPVYDAGSVDEAPFYVMRRVSGRPLEQLVTERALLSERLALVPHMLACAQAVAHAHQRGIIHRDIKPTNILVGELGETMVIDWGLAKVIGERDDDADDAMQPFAGDSLRTRIGVVAGTPGFMAPEQARGEPAREPSDVYALGATMYYVLARRPPHSASDADEMIQLTALRAPAKIGTLVPGVPNELAAIVDKALAFDPADRYQDAAAFAEELQRFLTGQLVASHRYTARERLVRFARKHRAAVAIGIIAAVVIAGVSTFAIGSVLSERDRADEQARLALEGRHEAELARTREANRADSELVSRARTIVDTKPTAALAALKLLPRTSDKRAEADAIARTAIARGGAIWAIHARAVAAQSIELDRSGDRIVIVYRDGTVEVWDLVRRTRINAKQFGERTRALWLADGSRILIYGLASPQLYDPATGGTEVLGLPLLSDVRSARSANVMMALDRNSAVGVLDLASRSFRPLWPGHVAHDLDLPDDGSWLAAADAHGAVVWDPAGNELTHFAGDYPLLTASASKRLTLQTNFTMFETVVGPRSTWRSVPMPMRGTQREITTLAYDDELLLGRGISRVYALHQAAPFSFGGNLGTQFAVLNPIGSEQQITISDEGHLYMFDRYRWSTITLPEAVPTPKLTSRRGRSRAVVFGGGVILVLDLSPMLPQRLPFAARAQVVLATDQALLIDDWHNTSGWVWYDFTTGVESGIALPSPVARLLTTDLEERALFVDPGTTSFAARDPRWMSRFTVVKKDSPVRWTASDELGVLATLIPGNAVVYADHKYAYASIGDQPFTRILTLDGPPHAVVEAGSRRAAVVTETSLYVADLEAGTSEQIKVTLPDGPILHVGGRFVIGDGDRLRWSEPGGAELARFEAPIATISPCPSGVLVGLVGGGWLFVQLEPVVAVHRLAPALVGGTYDGSRVIVRTADQLEIIDLPSRVRSTIAIPPTPITTQLWLSPNGRVLIERAGDGTLWRWELARDQIDLDQLTNATENEDGLVTWPWQVMAPRSPSPSRTAP